MITFRSPRRRCRKRRQCPSQYKKPHRLPVLHHQPLSLLATSSIQRSHTLQLPLLLVENVQNHYQWLSLCALMNILIYQGQMIPTSPVNKPLWYVGCMEQRMYVWCVPTCVHDCYNVCILFITLCVYKHMYVCTCMHPTSQ